MALTVEIDGIGLEAFVNGKPLSVTTKAGFKRLAEQCLFHAELMPDEAVDGAYGLPTKEESGAEQWRRAREKWSGLFRPPIAVRASIELGRPATCAELFETTLKLGIKHTAAHPFNAFRDKLLKDRSMVRVPRPNNVPIGRPNLGYYIAKDLLISKQDSETV